MPVPLHELIPLGLLLAGQSARIEQVLGGTAHVQRLQELGIRDGAEVEMVQPGSPCILRVGNQKLCVRSEELSAVLVSALPDGVA